MVLMEIRMVTAGLMMKMIIMFRIGFRSLLITVIPSVFIHQVGLLAMVIRSR